MFPRHGSIHKLIDIGNLKTVKERLNIFHFKNSGPFNTNVCNYQMSFFHCITGLH